MLVAVPISVVMLIMPVVALVGTIAVREVSDTTLKVALTPLKLTAVVPVKLAPVIVTDVPTVPLVGKKLVIVGLTPKLLVLVAVPSGVVTLIAPVVAPVGTVVVIAVSETTLKVALTPLKLTLVAPVKFAPVIVKLVPTMPLVGEKFVIVGGKVTMKLLVLVAVPLGVVTLISPVVATLGTVAAIEVSDTTLKVAVTLLKMTEVAPVKLLPLIVTAVPIVPLVGEKLVIFGLTAKLLTLVAVPFGVVTLITPAIAPTGTVVVMEVSESTLNVALTPLNWTLVAPVKFVPVIATDVPTMPLVGEKLTMAGVIEYTSLLTNPSKCPLPTKVV